MLLGTSQVMSNNARIPFWISSPARSELNSILGNLLDSGKLSSSDRETAMEISQELGVATTRFSHSRIPAHLLQQALNVSSQKIPLHLSSEEIDFLNRIDLPEHIGEFLNE